MAADMRLRLIIRRHGLPEVKILWPCAASEELTVASLLMQVNEVVTLESGQWGLEDYVVELADQDGGSFECLHFQQVGKLLKQDDQVVIRSLLTEDLKQRRISGRHQISGDGIHLVDGIPFGRRRGPRDRPTLALPPRKRARIAYDSDDEDEEVEDLSRLLLEDTPRPDEDGDYDGDGDFGDDDSGADDEDDDVHNDLEEELQFLHADSETPENPSDCDTSHRTRRREEPKQAGASSQLLKLEGMTPAALVALQAAFPLTPSSTLEGQLDAHGSNLEATYKDLASANDPNLNYDEMMSIFMETRFNHVSAPEPVLLTEAPKASKPLIQEIEDVQRPGQSLANGSAIEGVDDATDDTSDTSETSSESDDGSDLAPATRAEDNDNDSSSDTDDSDFNSNDEDSEDGDSDELTDSESSGPLEGKLHGDSPDWGSASSDSGSSDNTHDDSTNGASIGDANVKGPKSLKTLIQDVTGNESSEDDSSSEASDSYESSSSSDDDAESSPGPEQVSSIFKDAFPDASSSSSSDSDSSAREAPVQEAQVLLNKPEVEQESGVGRGQGLSRTQKRNARRRLAKEKLKEQKQLKLNPDSAGTVKAGADPDNVPIAVDAAETSPAADQDLVMEEASLEQKRAELSRAIKNAQVASSEESSSSDSESSSDSSSDSGSDPGPSEEPIWKGNSRPKIEVVETIDMEQPQEIPSAEATASPKVDLTSTQLRVDGSGLPVSTPNTADSKDESARKRMRVDMGAGRRLLFGALGLKNPKNKTDEEKLKKDLMKDVRPHQNPRQETSEKPVEPEAEVQPEAEEEDDWRDKITYRAVECCYEGMELSEPPFPFVQRWDPQQQYNSMRKRKRDSQHFEEYYDEDSRYGTQDHGSSKKKKNKGRRSKQQEVQREDLPNEDNAHIELDYDDAPTNPQVGDTQVTDLDDLPSLPADPNTLPPVHPAEAKVGMVIAWPRLQLSKATNWQPQIQWVGGMIVSLDHEKVHLILAKRDRDRDERVFDEDGNRIYDRFEMPEDDELDEEYKPDDGRREMLWSDLTDARLVQGEPSPSMLNSPAEGSFHGPDIDFFAGQTETRSQPPASSVIDDVDSLQVRAGMEEDLANVPNEDHQPPQSSSIPSGQNHPFMDFAPSVVEEPSNSAVSEERSQPSISDKTARDDLQSQSKAPGTVVKDSQNLAAHPIGTNGSPQQDSADERVPATDDDEAIADVDDEGEPDAHGTPSVNMTHASSQQNGQKDQTPSIDYPQLLVPSSANDIGTGRQPQSEMSPPIQEDADGTPVPQTEPSSDPFPALDEVWHTVKTSKTQQSPLKSSQGSALVNKSKKPKHKAAISSRGTGNGGTADRKLFPNATQPAADLPTLASSSQSPRRSSRRRSQPQSSPFVIPEGSQVVALSSSPASEKFDENYAEDDVDDNYEDPATSSLPKGQGWVTKKPGRGRPRRASNR